MSLVPTFSDKKLLSCRSTNSCSVILENDFKLYLIISIFATQNGEVAQAVRAQDS